MNDEERMNRIYSTYTTAGVTLQRDGYTPLQRRRALGVISRKLDCPGFWLHVSVSAEGIPTDARILEVTDTEWHYLNDDKPVARAIDRPPTTGILVYLY